MKNHHDYKFTLKAYKEKSLYTHHHIEKLARLPPKILILKRQ